jgi:hypothetical protein
MEEGRTVNSMHGGQIKRTGNMWVEKESDLILVFLQSEHI